ncbi:MAG: alpha-ketoglutarate-dependent dioxygenase AlkB [Winogradskyella sp.]|uniref:alpha-ketoglutarate-dependent dioxygenase AlkB family protein n=1 Tax=Winogradskyella sp. TaxID=1883156 RepID=UPI000F3B91EC|nr:alpha-ketoglutarate-dependent dioxygenase AlkB [Winogradskyella sp.]RNC84936.1 MAG: alpha-ketoglutarate-dependent dioxygenase AlkB [Winogradskyella sp.]
MDLFSETHQPLNLPDAELIYIPNFFSQTEADNYFNSILKQTDWQQDDITVFGKTYKQPRLTALYGSSLRPYSYSNITMYPKPFPGYILDIKKRVESIAHHEFNTVLLNLYRNGNDSNGWHSDNEKELGKHPIIASVTFGEERPFHFKHRQLKEQRHKIILKHGSLLIMKGTMQSHWLHQIAKTRKVIEERINLTFRTIIGI